jgi:ribosomal 50S subunit-recycling heat shock protein
LLAVKLIEAGKVRINIQRALKVCRHMRLGDVVTGTRAAAGHLFVVRFAGEAQRRGPSGHRARYEDLTPKAAAPAVELARIEVHRGLRPTKRDRRRLDAIKADDV